MPSEFEHRLICLETRVAHQDDTIEKLNILVKAHQKELYRLTTRFEHLLTQFHLLQNRQEPPVSDEKPPHY